MTPKSAVRRLLQFLSYSNVWVALVATGLAFQTGIASGSSLPLLEGACVFFFVLSSYSFQRLFIHSDVDAPYRDAWWYKNKMYLGIQAGLAGLAALMLLPTRWLEQEGGVLCLSILGLISLLYAIPLFPNGTAKRIALRELPFVKIFLIAISWAFMTTLFPHPFWNGLATQEQVLLLLERFLWVFAFTIPFDMRVVPNESVQTIPMQWGSKWGLVLSVGLSALALGLMFHSSSNFDFIWGGLGSIVLLLFVKPTRDDLFFHWWLEGALLGPLTAWTLLNGFIF